MLERIVVSLNEVKEGDFIDVIIDAEPENVLKHLGGISSKYEVRDVGSYSIIRIWKEKEIEEISEEELEINENTNIGKLIEKYPEAIDILVSYGFTPLKKSGFKKDSRKDDISRKGKDT